MCEIGQLDLGTGGEGDFGDMKMGRGRTKKFGDKKKGINVNNDIRK